jgi:transposase
VVFRKLINGAPQHFKFKRLIGPALAALLVWLHFRMYLSVRRCQEFSGELLGLSLSVGAIASPLRYLHQVIAAPL